MENSEDMVDFHDLRDIFDNYGYSAEDVQKFMNAKTDDPYAKDVFSKMPEVAELLGVSNDNSPASAEDKLDYEIVNDKSIDAIKDNFTPPGAKSQKEDVKDEIDTNDNGKIEEDEMADFQKSLDDYAAKNKKGREDIPATYKR